MAITKNRADVDRRYDAETLYAPTDAVDLVKTLSFAKFDESVDVAYQLGIDARQADQIVRGTVSLPHGTGKDVKVVVFANEQAREAEEAGADVVGGKDLALQTPGGPRPDGDDPRVHDHRDREHDDHRRLEDGRLRPRRKP